MQKIYLTAKGVKKSVTEWAKELGIDPVVIHVRRARGWTPEECVELSPRAKRTLPPKEKAPPAEKREKQLATYAGVTSTVSDICRRFGVSDSVVRSRMRLGWTIAKAIETPLKGQK